MSNESPIIQVPSEEDESNSSGVVQHLKELSASLKTLRESDELTDSVLIVENKRFPVHRVILAARCDYFRALFYGGMKESSRDAELEVELKETPAEAFSYLLRYIYDGQITLSSLPCQVNKINVVLPKIDLYFSLCHTHAAHIEQVIAL